MPVAPYWNGAERGGGVIERVFIKKYKNSQNEKKNVLYLFSFNLL